MKILIPTDFNKNPYIYQIVKALQKKRSVEVVHTLVPWLFQTEYHFDILHLQWPESIVSKKNFSQDNTDYIDDCLKGWKKRGSRIVATIHNEMPHNHKNKTAHQFYSMIYEHCDGLLHMGERSKNILHENYQLDLKNTVEVVVRHGNYNCFPNTMNRSEARSILGIPHDMLTIASVSAIRSDEEYHLLNRFNSAIKRHNGILLQIGALKTPNRFLKRRFRETILSHRKNFRYCKSYIENRKIQLYLNACDLLLIPRFEALNSGNVALGFTFGKILMGPDYGVIGEELKATGNPVFKDLSQHAVDETLNRALSLINTDLGERNMKYAMNELDWDILTDEYLSLYNRLAR